MRKQRILIVYQHLPHYREGVFRQLDLNSNLDITFAADTSSRDGSIPTIDPSVLNRFHRLRNFWFGPFLWQRGLASQLVVKRYDDVIFLGDWKYLSTWLGQLIARARGTRTYLWTIGWHRPDHGLKKHLRKAFYRLSDRLLLYGQDGRDLGIDAGFPAEKMRVIGNSHLSGLEPAPNSTPPTRLATDHTFTVGAVVRLQPVKRLDLLLQAAKLLKDQGNPIRVILVGDGPAREQLEILASKFNLDVNFTGAVYEPAQLRRIYSEIDLTVLPEAAGLTVMQSLSHGVPVVTSNSPHTQMPEFRAVIDGVTGSLYEPGNIRNLADKIYDWMLRLDLDGRGKIRVACLHEIEQNWTPEVHAERILNAIKRDPSDLPKTLMQQWLSRITGGR